MKLSYNSTLAGAFALFIIAPISGCRDHVDASVVDAPVVPVSRVIHTELNNNVTLTAELQPYFEVDVMAKQAGYIRHMLVDIGDHVKAGQLIAVLEIPELQDDMQRAKADVQTAVAMQSAAEQDKKRAAAAEAIAHLSYTRIQDVSKSEPGLVPLQEVDVAHSRDLEAEAQVAAAEQNVQASISRLQSARAQLDHENALVAYTRIVSPLNGVITQRFASDGSMIQAGTNSNTQAMPVVRVSQDDILRLMLPVPEENVGGIHNGQAVSVIIPSVNRTFAGTVTRSSDRVDSSTRTMIAEVDLKNPKLDLIPGMYAQVQLNLANASDALAVPVGAVEATGGTSHLYVVDTNGIVHIRAIKTGLQTPKYVQLISGARPDEIVVLGRHSDLQDGEKVQPHFE